MVTGGAKGIGRATTIAFAVLGDRVVALGRDTDALEELPDALGAVAGNVVTARCDVASEAEVEECFGGIGAVDVLVNNAGVAASAPLAKTSLASWEEQISVNATAAFLCTRAVLPGMLERGEGSVLTVASTAGKVGARYTAAYTASKHAAVGLMRATAAEVAATGVRANAVCPTFVDTEMTERSVAGIAAATGRDEEESRRALERSAPLGRLVDPHEVAAALAWLASAEAAPINGQTVVIDGGGIQA